MKTNNRFQTTILIAILGLSTLLFNACSSDNSNDDQQQEENNDTTDDTNDDQGVTVDPQQKIEGIYFLAGPGVMAGDPFNSIKTDNPSVNSLPRSGKVFFATLGIDTNTVPFIIIATQATNSNNDVFDTPHVTDFGYNIITIVRSQDAPELQPNIRIGRIEDVTFSPNGQQGQDINSQTILDLDTGAFTITSLTDDILFNGDDGQLSNSYTAIVDPSSFPRNEDGAITSNIADELNAEIQIPDILEQLFNDDNTTSIEAVMVEFIRGTPGIDGNGDTIGQITTFRPYN